MPATRPNPESWGPPGIYHQHICIGCGCVRWDDEDENPTDENCDDSTCPCHAYYHEVRAAMRERMEGDRSFNPEPTS
jgi:hypothetical protein